MPKTKTMPQFPEKTAASMFAGFAAIALAIIGLAGVFPRVLLSVSTIALGAALLFHAGVVAAKFSALTEETGTPSRASRYWGGMTIGFLAGAVGVALGLLALLNVSPMVLMPIAAILYGTALIMDSGVNARLNALEAERSAEGFSREWARENAAVASGVQMIVGLAGVTLGILALLGTSTSILTLTAMLSIAAALILSVLLVGGRMYGAFRE